MSAGVVPADIMPGELLVQATETAVVTSTLVLGCLFAMLSANAQVSESLSRGMFTSLGAPLRPARLLLRVRL